MTGPSYHGRTHLPTGTDPIPLDRFFMGESSLMGQVAGPARLTTNGFGLLSGTLYIPDRDGPPLESGETITIDYSHVDTERHFSWMAVRLHLVTGLTDSMYAPFNPWESNPWAGGIGSYTTTSRFWSQFTSFVAVTNTSGDVVTWTHPFAGVEQFSWDLAATGHIGYSFHDFGVGSTTDTAAATFGSVSTEKVGSIQFNTSTGAVTVGSTVGTATATNTVRCPVTLSGDVPAGSGVIVMAACKVNSGDVFPGDAGNRPNMGTRLPTGNLILKVIIDGQAYPIFSHRL